MKENSARSDQISDTWRIKPLAQDHVVVHKSICPAEVYMGSPSIVALANGRLVASMNQAGPGVEKYCGTPVGTRYCFGHKVQGLIYTSDDGGKKWIQRVRYPFFHARLFVDGEAIYLLGHVGNIMIMKSADGGDNWSEPTPLTDADDRGGRYTQAPANVLFANGKIYLIMMYLTDLSHRGYFVSALALAGLRSSQGAELLKRENWYISPPSKAFRDFVPDDELNFFGVPFYNVPDRNKSIEASPGRTASRVGWHEAHILRIEDEDHLWHDPCGSTFHVLARADAHRSNYGALAVMREKPDGTISFELQTTPAGTNMVFLPLPGGNIKFHVLYDKLSRLYWLLGSQITDSMTRPDRLPAGRYGLPLDQRERLVLHFSKNLVDWQFAALVAAGQTARECRHYASMDIAGGDLCILSRSGDKDAVNAHDCNLITFHRVRNFRNLIY